MACQVNFFVLGETNTITPTEFENSVSLNVLLYLYDSIYFHHNDQHLITMYAKVII